MNVDCVLRLSVSFIPIELQGTLYPKIRHPKRGGRSDHHLHSLAQFWSTCSYYMEKQIDADETQNWLRCPMCMHWLHETCLQQCFFWLINLSNGLIFLIFVLDLGLDNMFLIFKVYVPNKLRNIQFMNMQFKEYCFSI